MDSPEGGKPSWRCKHRRLFNPSPKPHHKQTHKCLQPIVSHDGSTCGSSILQRPSRKSKSGGWIALKEAIRHGDASIAASSNQAQSHITGKRTNPRNPSSVMTDQPAVHPSSVNQAGNQRRRMDSPEGGNPSWRCMHRRFIKPKPNPHHRQTHKCSQPIVSHDGSTCGSSILRRPGRKSKAGGWIAPKEAIRHGDLCDQLNPDRETPGNRYCQLAR